MIFQLSRKQVVILTERFKRTKSVEERVAILFQYIQQNEAFFQNVLFLIIDYYRQNGSGDPENFIQDISEYYRKSIGDLIGLGDTVASSAIFSFSLGLIIQSVMSPKNSDREEQVLLIRKMIEVFLNQALKVA
jgi:hypothetical protein